VEFNLADLFERVADTVPEHVALVCGTRRLTYAELDERATRLANALADRGVRAGDHVALYLYNSTEYLEGMLAAFKLRAVPINVNYRYVAAELRYLLADADATAVIAHDEFVPVLDEVRAELPQLRIVLVAGNEYEAALAAASPKREFPPRSPDDLYLLYTGGTTGMPKGVMWRHEDVFFGAMGGGTYGGDPIAAPEEIAEHCQRPRTRCLPACPFMHGTAHWMAFGILFTGGTVIISEEHRFDPVALWRLIASEAVNVMIIVGDAFARPLLDALDDPALDGADASGLHVLVSGGAILSPSIKRALVERLPRLLVVDGYGASESGAQGQSVVVAGGEIPDAPRFKVSADTQVLDDDLQPVAPGVVGRIARRGRIPLGYYKDPAKSAATFPEIDGVRWAVPGDHAIVDTDGVITLLGRGSVSINTGGEKVYPEEVEAALKSHADVFDAIVVGVDDDRFGQRIVAVVQPRTGAEPSLTALQTHARQQLAGYKVPRGVVFVDTIRRSPSGKPDYRWARATAEAEATPA
jgi:fatty-acyl-CoA synthase